MSSKRPGGEMAKRPLHFIWLVDCSGSMQGDKIQSVNFGIREAITPMRDAANENPTAQLLVRAITFASGAQWIISQPTDINSFTWTEVAADGVTDMGQALEMVAQVLKMEVMGDRALPPVLALISDGIPTDNFGAGLKKLMAEPWGKKAVRVAIAIGQDADHEPLQKFIGNSEIKPIQVDNPQALVRSIKWLSTTAVKAVSMPVSQVKGKPDSSSNVPMPAPPQLGPSSASDPW